MARKKVATVGGVKVVRELVASYRTNEIAVPFRGTAIKAPDTAYDMFKEMMEACPWERFVALYLDGRNKVITWSEISSGTPTQTIPHISVILRNGLLASAANILVIHNHPSGMTTPSQEDRRFTCELREGCRAVEMPLLDHIIIGDGRYYSFSESGV